MTAYGVFLGLVRGLWSIVTIMEYPAETINIREGMGTAVRNVKHTKGWHFVIFGAWLNVGARTAMWQVAQLSAFAIFEVAHVVCWHYLMVLTILIFYFIVLPIRISLFIETCQKLAKTVQ